MISATLRLFLIYSAIWWCARQWPVGREWFVQLVEQLQGASGAYSPLATLLVLALALTLVRVLTLPFWVAPVPLDRARGPTRHPFPDQPFRIQLRFRRTRFFIVTLLETWLAVSVFTAIDWLNLPNSAIETPRYFGDWRDPALAMLFIHLAVWMLAWSAQWLWHLLLRGATAGNGFVRYQLDHIPVRRFMTRMLLGVHMSWYMFVAAVTDTPELALVALASMLSLISIAFAGDVLTLLIEIRRDKWLANLRHARINGSKHYSARELAARCIAFLQPGDASVVALALSPAVAQGTPVDSEPEPSPDSGPDSAASVVPPVSAEEITPEIEFVLPDIAVPPSSARMAIDRAEEQLDAGENARARRALREAVATGDADERDEAEALLRDAGGGIPWRALFATCVVGIAVLTAFVGWHWLQLPSAAETLALARSAHVHVRKAHDSKLTLLGNRYDYSLNTSLDNISKHFVHAVIASEDHRFYSHGTGYMVAKFAQAGAICVIKKFNVFATNRACAGNSTLPQQLARNLFLSESRSINRKLKELLWAIKMQAGLTKDEILELYLNRLYLGRGNFGVELGARDYFGKSASELNLNEAALLAAAIKRPGWNWRQDRKSALKRAQLIVALMRKHDYAPAQARFPANYVVRRGVRAPIKPYLGHLWQWIRNDVAVALKDLPAGDYKVMTSLDAEVEIYAERHLRRQVAGLRRAGIRASQAAAVVMRPDGHVLAMVGGVGDSLAARGFNRAKNTEGLIPRPPASSFKPFVYLAALEAGLRSDSTIDARPVSINVPGDPKPYRPQNHDKKNYSYVTMREGLERSINTAAVRLLHDQLGFERLFKTLAKLGLDTTTFARRWGLALGSEGVPLIDMVSAYAVIANGGARVEARGFTAIATESGKIVWRAHTRRQPQQFARGSIRELSSMLEAVVSSGTGYRARQKLPRNQFVAGKTGTGDDFVDAWFIGYTKDLVIGVWIGNDRPRSMSGVYGGTAPARAFNGMLRDIVKHTDVTVATAGG